MKATPLPMISPSRYIIRMVICMAVILAVAGGLYEPLIAAFKGNMVINSIILAAFVLGVGFMFRQALRLLPEHHWMATAARAPAKARKMPPPVLLAQIALNLEGKGMGHGKVAPETLRPLLDAVADRIEEGREISRYMVGLLVFLGLLGTFWGLLTTVSAVGNVVAALDTDTSDITAMMVQLKEGLDAPLAGMATAFSSSLFGLGGSLVLGFLDLQLGQASGRFYADLEDWLGKPQAQGRR